MDEHSGLLTKVRLSIQFHLFDDLGNRLVVVPELSLPELAAMDDLHGGSLVSCCSQYLWIWRHPKVQLNDL